MIEEAHCGSSELDGDNLIERKETINCMDLLRRGKGEVKLTLKSPNKIRSRVGRLGIDGIVAIKASK